MSTPTSPNDDRLDLQLPAELKRAIEEAAVLTGQSVSSFAASTLARTARDVIERETVTRLSNHDREVFVSSLDDNEARPNEALAAAAMNYISRRGRR
jgi:uncharacterized protein (DUF1778 family)